MHCVQLCLLCVPFFKLKETAENSLCPLDKREPATSEARRSVHVSANSSTKSGVTPSVPAQVSSREETNEEAKAFPQEMANILVHLRCQAQCADRRKMAGASRAFAAAKALTNLKASSLQRPPVSTPTTTRWQRSPSSNSAYFLSLSRLALTNTAPSTCAAFPEGRPAAESADRSVMSTASWAPWCKGKPDATTSMARWSVVWTATFMSCSRQLHLTMAPASRHTRAMVCSVGKALERNLPDLGHAPLCRPSLSNGDPHSQRDSVTWIGNLILSRRRVRNNTGCTVYST